MSVAYLFNGKVSWKGWGKQSEKNINAEEWVQNIAGKYDVTFTLIILVDKLEN